MNRTATCLSVLILPEDSGPKAFETLRALAKELLKQVDEHVHTNRISFEPVRNELALQAIHSTIWKSTRAKDRQKQVELIRTIATQVLMVDGWVLFHFDGDREWSTRDSSENVKKFQTLVYARVRELVVLKLTELRDGSTPQALEARAHARLTRLKTVVPFYSIEAWLFQNNREAIRLCQESYSGRDVEQFQAWAQDRTALDEVLKPKEAVSMGAAHNLDLASHGFPAREVHAAGKSFAATVDTLKQDGELRDALARTYAY
ncbi:hypothetical protein D187_000977 [Cystobacter fuscus DSM 2262]|uniref:Uncharacterized protein n=1 Tax=Cystobacter fuscus (strain ATCC 25194 / DSM 2262 / NBRC 100088 / M29) TaxID=1242864 RepID=S9QIV4_CYSF2|nr:hypothetical protein [Cystobacter fuscus]EPX61194.1 hypothetical protein D187_000977 [Cystobacter fuscus DSM 2262]